jgi:hypothetical protein
LDLNNQEHTTKVTYKIIMNKEQKPFSKWKILKTKSIKFVQFCLKLYEILILRKNYINIPSISEIY